MERYCRILSLQSDITLALNGLQNPKKSAHGHPKSQIIYLPLPPIIEE
jgi:hypothetical protein